MLTAQLTDKFYSKLIENFQREYGKDVQIEEAALLKLVEQTANQLESELRQPGLGKQLQDSFASDLPLLDVFGGI